MKVVPANVGGHPRRRIGVLLACSAMSLAVGQAPAVASSNNVTAVQGSAFGYHADNIVLLGGSQSDTGPTPSVALASNASNSPQTASATTGLVAYGPATLFTSDDINVSATGSLGTSGAAASTASVDDVNQAGTQSSTGTEILTATGIDSSCSASPSGNNGSTTITSGTLYTDSGWDDGDAFYPESAANAGGTAEHNPVVINLASTPAANTSHGGHIHLSGTVTDTFTVVLNEQVTNGNSLVVNAVHEYFIGPSLVGDLIIGQASCGVTH